MLIFRHEEGQKFTSPEQLQAWMKQTMEWIGGIASQGMFSGGNALPFVGGKVVHHNNLVTDVDIPGGLARLFRALWSDELCKQLENRN